MLDIQIRLMLLFICEDQPEVSGYLKIQIHLMLLFIMS